MQDSFFPYKTVRDEQKQLMQQVDDAISKSQNLIAHAPTGLGKTIATLCPALKHALDKDLTIFFLTSRHTQHLIAIDTLKLISKKFRQRIITTDIIGKKWMCPVPGTDKLYSNEFAEYCKAVREDNTCEYYSNTKQKNKLTPKAKKVLKQIEKLSPYHSEQIIKLCSEEKLCPYELTTALAKNSKVIIGDYYYVFDPFIRKNLFGKADKELEKSIIIVDEAHNLPQRLRNLMSVRLSTFMLDRAIKESKKFGYEQTQENLVLIKKIITQLSHTIEYNETTVSKDDFSNKINKFTDYDQLIKDLIFIADQVRETEKQSYISSIANFMAQWKGPDSGFCRIITKQQLKQQFITLSYRCLDPSLVSSDVVNNAHSTILMSGTLTPTSMYKDLIGFENATEAEFKSPFPESNKLTMVIPETTTKYTMRSDDQYKRIAEICAEITNTVPGNTILFFPSYKLRDEVDRHFIKLCRKTTFSEVPNLNKKEKKELLDKFKSYSKMGAVLLAVVSGSFGEGIDMPGDFLKAAVVVGIPLQTPDLETKALIKYYNEKFERGMDYGYIMPAMNKAMQNAGRVIRSETDRGALIFLDERYAWPYYKRCFPDTWNIVVTKLWKERLEEFFSKGIA